MISVIIPAYNSELTILRAIDSVKNQTVKANIEIIVVNDGSKDNTQALVERYQKKNPDINLMLINQLNGGVSKARNTGIKNSKGQYLAFLDSDDAWFDDKLELQLKCIIDNSSIDFLAAGFDGLYFNKEHDGKLIKVDLKKLMFKNYFQPSTVFMKKEIINKVGFFDENQKYAEEGNYFMRIAKFYNCYFLNKKLINYGDGKSGFGESGLSANMKEMQKGVEKNLKFALKHKYIDLPTFFIAFSFSKIKYLRRILIVKFRR